MFHTYIRAASGVAVDFDRASFLMDKELLASAIGAMSTERDTCPRPDATYDAQWVWQEYCQRHHETYGQPFVPDVDPAWDQGGANQAAPGPYDGSDRHGKITAMTKPTGMIRIGDFAVPANFAELAAAQGPLDEPYPMFSLMPFQMIDVDALPKPWPTLPLEPGYGPPYDCAPQGSGSASTSQTATVASSEPQATAVDIGSAENLGAEGSSDRSGKS